VRTVRHGRSSFVSEVVCGRKFCARCGRWRHVCDFERDPRNRTSGLYSWCRACHRIWKRERYARRTPAERELINEYRRIWNEVQRRRAGIPPRNWRTLRPLPPRDQGELLDPAPLLTAMKRWDGSQRALARKSGVPPRQLYRIESGESRRVQLNVADRLALALGIPLELLYPYDRSNGNGRH
jgi:hypothetical protein